MPRLQPVESSSIESVAYSPSGRRLYVRFRESRDLYVYHDVPADVIDSFEAAASKGRFVNIEIKPRSRCDKL